MQMMILAEAQASLTVDDARELWRCETVIERGLGVFVEVGNALQAIRDKRLYRAEYGTFEAYCRERWGISRPRAYQMVEASSVVENLSTIADITMPTNKYQTRQLTRLSLDQQCQAWTQAVETAPNGKVTGTHVRAVVEEMLDETQPKPRQTRKSTNVAPVVRRFPAHRANDLDGTTWIRHSISVWSDIRKDAQELGLEHPAIFPAALAEWLIQSFTTANAEIILDPMAGSGSTLVAAKRLGKIGVGVELCEEYATMTWDRLERTDGPGKGMIYVGDADHLLDFVGPESVDFSVTSPPYWDILSQRRTADGRPIHDYVQAEGNVGCITDYAGFLDALKRVYGLVYRTLKPGAYFCVVVMDVRKRDRLYLLHADLIRAMQDIGFIHDDVIIWDRRQEYNNLRPLGFPAVFRVNRVHEYVLIFKKPG